MVDETPVIGVLFQVATGAVGSIVAVGALRLFTSVLDFLPRQLHDVSIGTSYESFHARGPGDTYDHVLWIRFRNSSSVPIFIARCVYFAPPRMPVYENARRSQKYRRAYEVKFGHDWTSQSVLVEPGQEIQSYVPMNEKPTEPPRQGARGTLLLEYCHGARTGRHRARL